MNSAATLTAGLGNSSFFHADDASETHNPVGPKRQHHAAMDAQKLRRASPPPPLPPAPSTMAVGATATIANRRQSSIRGQYRPPLGPRPLDFSSYKRVTSDTMSSQQSPTRRSFLTNGTSDPFLGLSARHFTSNLDSVPAHDMPSSTTTRQMQGASKTQSGTNGDYSGSSLARSDPNYDPGVTTNLNGYDVSTKSSNWYASNPSFPNNRSTAKDSTVKQRNPALRAAQLSTASATGAPVVTPLTIRTRRQSQFPATASTRIDPRLSRQSVGPGMLLPVSSTDVAPRSPHSLPHPLNLNGNIPAEPASRSDRKQSTTSTNTHAQPSATKFQGGGVVIGEQPLKPSSGQPVTSSSKYNYTTSRLSDADSDGEAPNGAENSHQHTLNAKRLTADPTLALRRQNLGLARTVSPTNFRKSKRISEFPEVPPIPTPARSPTPDSTLRNKKRPPTPPRPKHSPQSSYRNTPEIIQNAVAGRSVSSRSSFGSLRPSSSSAPNNSTVIPLSSKQIDTRTKPGEKVKLEGLEMVPPVPAIPKAFESPNHSTEEPFFSAAESLDTASKTDSIPSEPPNDGSRRGSPTKPQPRTRRRFTLGNKLDSRQNQVQQSSSRQAQSKSRLPPLNLLPIGNSTSDKIASLTQKKASQNAGDQLTPTSKSFDPKTPTTPMTASRAMFSNSELHKNLTLDSGPRWRSASANRENASEFSALLDSGTSSPMTFLTPSPPPPLPTNDSIPDLPAASHTNAAKGGNEQDSTTKQEAQIDARASRIMNFRSRAFSRSGKDSNPSRASNTARAENNNSTNTVKRKLSLGWRRSSSKASHSHATDDGADANLDTLPTKLPAPELWTETLSPSADQTKQLPVSNVSESSKSFPTYDETNGLEKPEEGEHKEEDITSSASDLDRRQLAVSDRNTYSRSPMHRLLGRPPASSTRQHQTNANLDRNDTLAEEEMRKLAGKKKEFETAAKSLDQLRQRASPKERLSPSQAASTSHLNIFERGEVIDYPDVFFCGLRDAQKCVGDLASQLSNFGFDDERGDYNIVVGDHLAYRYEVIDILGKGSFGQVVRCIDHKSGKLGAVKIIRNKKRFHQQALVEVNLLQKLRDWDPDCKHSNVEFTQSFYFRGHLCIATELLGMNLYEFIKAHEFHGFPLRLIRRFTRQMLGSLWLLHGHKVIHCDLKPENILLCHPLHSEIKVIDFGSSCFENEKVYTYIQSRFYRSPEVILGMEYGMPIDMWSLGCILAELFTGFPIFPGENEQEQLACIMEIFGPPEKHLIEKSSRKKLFFDSLGKPRVTVSSKGKRRRPSSKTLQQALKCDDESFLDFITQCLRWDPERRLKPDVAISHDFVTGIKTRVRGSANSSASSPAKRPVASTQTPAKPIRPLPEVPQTANRVAPNMTSRVSSGSPVKAATSPRRHSTMVAAQTGATIKRNYNGQVVGSTLPRSISGKPDMASAAAIASLQRQR